MPDDRPERFCHTAPIPSVSRASAPVNTQPGTPGTAERVEEEEAMARQTPGVRALAVISTLVGIVVLLLASAVWAGDAGPATEDYRVRSGDSLWSIALSVAEPGEDVRGVVASIRDLNDLNGSLIHPGDLLTVPAASGTPER
jgi:nucleoid-associated protein YgaU